VDLSVAQGRPSDPGEDLAANGPATIAVAVATGVLLAIAAFAIYRITYADRYYDHFVWQAAAFLEGQAAIRYPIATTAERLGNWFFQDVLPVGRIDGIDRGLIPFPPLPAILLVPFVAAFGFATDDQLLFTILAAIDVALCWWMLGRLRVSTVVRLGTTVFFAFGTAFWYTAQNTTTWHQAHIVAVGLTMLAVGLALGADESRHVAVGRPAERDRDRGGSLSGLDRRGFAIGLLFGLATTARLTVILAAPFFMLVGPGRSWRRRSRSVGIGAAIPVVALLAYNIATTGHVFHPAYDHLYQLEARAYTGLGYHLEWAAEDPRYLPQNLAIMLYAAPEVLPERQRDTLGTIDKPLCTAPGASRGLFDVGCPLALPRDIGMSILLTSPALLLGLVAFRDRARRRIVVAAATAVVLVTIVNLMHFSQGWVQFGYRFGNDTVPFALVLVALGFSWLVDRVPRPRWAMPLAVGLIGVSVAVNAWGVVWGRLLGW
jgi:hypothetical protein